MKAVGLFRGNFRRIPGTFPDVRSGHMAPMTAPDVVPPDAPGPARRRGPSWPGLPLHAIGSTVLAAVSWIVGWWDAAFLLTLAAVGFIADWVADGTWRAL